MVIELSGLQFGLKSYAWFQNWMSVQRKFDLKSQVWSQTKIARHKVQLPLYCIHFEIAQIQDVLRSNILLMKYWAGLKLNLSTFWGEKLRVLETKVAKFATWYSVFYFPAIWSVTLNKPWNLIGRFVFSVASPLLGKRWDLQQKMLRFMNKSHQLEPIRLQGPPVISKWV